jgi:hypothetical protein
MKSYLLEYLFIPSEDITKEELETQLCHELSALEAATEMICRRSCTTRYYDRGELIGVPNCACRWVAVFGLGRNRLCTLQRFCQSYQVLLTELLPSYTLQYSLDSFSFSSNQSV